MKLRTLVTAATLALLPVLASVPAAASVEVQSVSVQGGQLVLQVVDRPDSSAQVEVQIDGQTHRVSVSGLRPNQRRTVRTSIDVPCGTSTRVEAKVDDSTKTETLDVPCAGSSGASPSGGGSSGAFSSGSGGSSGSSGSSERDRFGQGTVTVDDRKNIRESNENDNQKTFTIERKRCRDAG